MSEDRESAAASKLREENQLGLSPIRDLPELIELLGFDVTVMRLPADVLAITRRDPETSELLVALGASNNPERQRFTAAHELGHIIFNDFRDGDITQIHRDGSETSADNFARHLLAPEEGVRNLIQQQTPEASVESRVAAVVRHFEVSPIVATIQMRRIGDLMQEQANASSKTPASWYAQRFGWAAERGARIKDSLLEQPSQRIAQRAMDAYVAGEITLRQLARVHGAEDVAAFQRQLEDEGIEPAAPDTPEYAIGDDW